MPWSVRESVTDTRQKSLHFLPQDTVTGKSDVVRVMYSWSGMAITVHAVAVT